jgi:hypothetical protein
VLSVAERGARAVVPAAVAAVAERDDAVGAEIVILLPGAEPDLAARCADAVGRELHAALPGHSFTLGRSRPSQAADLHRAAAEALLAANVADGDPEQPILAFEETGAYRLLLSAMSEDPAELQRFYAETVEPLVAYDEQYETELVQTVEAFLEADGNVAGTAQRLFTHRHTIRYRLEARPRAVGPGRRIHGRPREAQPGSEGDARARDRPPARPASEEGVSAGRIPRR